jgi:hypothetical protein
MDGEARVLALAVLGCLFAIGLAAVFFGPSIEDSYQAPDKGRMRAYLVSKLSDAQLIEKVFEHNLMSLCATAKNVREARQVGRLP